MFLFCNLFYNTESTSYSYSFQIQFFCDTSWFWLAVINIGISESAISGLQKTLYLTTVTESGR